MGDLKDLDTIETWRKPAPKVKRRRATSRARHDDLELAVGQIWRCPLPYTDGRYHSYLRIERIAGRSVFGPILWTTNSWLRPGAQVSFLTLRREWEHVEDGLAGVAAELSQHPGATKETIPSEFVGGIGRERTFAVHAAV